MSYHDRQTSDSNQSKQTTAWADPGKETAKLQRNAAPFGKPRS